MKALGLALSILMTPTLGAAFQLGAEVQVIPAQAGQSSSEPGAYERWKPVADRLVEPLLSNGLVPGIAVGVYDQGETAVWGYGTIGGGRDALPNGDTLFEIGSISKVLTATLLAESARRGEVALDDLLGVHLPAGTRPPQYRGKSPTLEQLATHHSGLARLPDNLKPADQNNPYADYSEDRLWDYLDGLALARAPGSKYEYSNLGAGLLGVVLARAAGMSYPDLLRKRLTEPLGMGDTTTRPEGDQVERFATAHLSGGVPTNAWEFGCLVGCGGIRSSANDLLKFTAATLRGGPDGLDEAMVSTRTVREKNPENGSAIALGWQIAADGVTLWHNGMTGGSAAALFIAPALDRGVVVLGNAADGNIAEVGEKMIQSMYGMTVQPPVVRAAGAGLTEAELERLVGVYSFSAFDITVTRDGTRLFAQLTNQGAIEVYAESATRFFYRVVEADLKFTLPDGGGAATAVTLFQDGREMRCERK